MCLPHTWLTQGDPFRAYLSNNEHTAETVGKPQHVLIEWYIQVITSNTCPEYGCYRSCILRSELYCHALGLIFNFLFRLEALVVPGSLNKRCGLFNLGKKARPVYSVVGTSANLNILMASHLDRTFLEKH